MSDTENSKIDEETKNSRRDFLKKAGKLAIYTPPAMMVLMKPSYATMSKSYCETGKRSSRRRTHSNGSSSRRAHNSHGGGQRRSKHSRRW